VGCQEKYEPEKLVRVVVDPSGNVFVDRFQKAPGRGEYSCFDRQCLEKAEKTRGFQRALKSPQVKIVVTDLAEQIVMALEKRIIDLLSIASVAKNTVSGMDSLGRAGNRVRGFVLAGDVASATEKRVRQWASARALPVVEYGDAETLGRTQSKPARVAIGVCEAKSFAAIMAAVNRRNRVLVAESNANT
jgi:hypothetical protein